MVTIVGAGMAGLITARMLMSKYPVTVIEAQPCLPDNHGALLRFRSDVVGKATNIPFKRVHVRKAICFDGRLHREPSPYLANMYSQKVTGSVLERSCWDLEPVDRYLAPDEFTERLATGVNILYGHTLTIDYLKSIRKLGPVISTIPMPVLMKMVDWGKLPTFEHKPVWSANATIQVKCDVYQTIYYPSHDETFYRVSIVGSHVIVEHTWLPDTPSLVDNRALIQHLLRRDFGIFAEVSPVYIKRQEYGKIVPLDNPELGREFIYAMSQELGIYSVGRFATWRQLLLDDIVHDVEVVSKLIASEQERKNYHSALERVKK